MSLRKKNTWNNISQSHVNHKNKIWNSYNLLIIFLAADGGWPPAANFNVVIKHPHYEVKKPNEYHKFNLLYVTHNVFESNVRGVDNA